MGVWARSVNASIPWIAGSALLAGVSPGYTLLRIHFGWGFYGDTTSTADLAAVAANIQVMGIVTTVGDGSESVPNARTASADADPPTQRWVYWEGRAPKVATYDADADVVTWQDSGAQEPVDTKGMVSAKSVPSGSSLNVWASWAPGSDWDDSGSALLWYYASLLYQPSLS